MSYYYINCYDCDKMTYRYSDFGEGTPTNEECPNCGSDNTEIV